MTKILNPMMLVVVILLISCKKEDTTNNNKVDTPPGTFGLQETPASALGSVNTFGIPSFAGTMPSSFFLQMPEVENQGSEGSCVAFATTYASRSYLMVNRPYNKDIYRSPEYVYNQIKVSDCANGSYFVNNGSYKGALNLLKSDGACSWNEMPYSDASCSTQPNTTQRTNAVKGKIIDFERITSLTTNSLKTILLNKFPIIIGARLDQGFMSANSSFIWRNSSGGYVGNHAIVICGYDDSKNAFKIINSWGKNWGDSGYTWIDYNYVSTVVFEAYIEYPDNSYTPNNLDDGLVLNLPFTGNTNDISGNNNNGINNGAVLTTDRRGNTNSAYEFNGSTSHIDVADANSLDVTQDATFSVWIYQTGTNLSPVYPNLFGGRIMDKANAGVDNGYMMDAVFLSSAADAFFCNCLPNSSSIRFIGGSGVYPTKSCYPYNTWQNITVTFQNGDIKIYYNGIEKNSKTITQKYIPTNNLPLRIGATQPLSGFEYASYKGKIDDIRIYNRALSASEVLQLYNL